MAPVPQPPALPRKVEREWTTPEQKAHLLSKQGEYSMARDHKTVVGWFSVELRTWRDTYIAYFHRINEDSSLTLADAMKMEQQVNDSIIKDLRARLLDITVAVASGVEGNFGEGEGEDHEDIKEDDEDQDQEAEDTGLSSDESNCPKSPYATPSQKNVVEEYKTNYVWETAAGKKVMGENDQQKVMRLEEVLLSHTSLERFAIQLLDQIFKQTGFVGSICLAGPDPQKGGKLMTMSIHKPLPNGRGFPDVYPGYKRAIADPMRLYSSLFFLKKIFFLFV
ncbi:hypothetical protein V8E52_009046 [Russula decolorans]